MNEPSNPIIPFLNKEFIKNKKKNNIIKKKERFSTSSKKFVENILKKIHKGNIDYNNQHKNILTNESSILPKNTDYSVIPENIRCYIEKKSKKNRIINHYSKFSIRGQVIELNITYFLKKIHISSIEKEKIQIYLDDCLHKIYVWLYVGNQYKSNECSQHLTINIYLTDLLKILPKEKYMWIDKEHANTAFTTSCQINTNINIFRKEEWFKVFIHETFHCLGLDFSHSDELNELANRELRSFLPFNIDYSLFDTYCEINANIINVIFCVYFSHNKKQNHLDRMISEIENGLFYEQIFSCFQGVKVLQHYGMTYSDLYENNNNESINIRKRYSEKTNVFAYYILKMILLLNIQDYLDWTYLQNQGSLPFKNTNENILSFIHIIKNGFMNKKVLEMIQVMEDWYDENKKNKSMEKKTLKMTALNVLE